MRTFSRWLLAAALVFAGVSHLFWARKEFQAQVPDFAAKVLDKDAVVVASGAVEIMLGASLVALPRSRRTIGAILAAFFVAVFPGNVEQFTHRRDGFGLDTDVKRLVRLFFQPLLVCWAIWSTRAPKN
ncbi:MAG: MauE/DoxX family redox-associated membrane protein [Microbacterium sp.]